MERYDRYETTFLNQLEIANTYYEKYHYRKELDRVFSSRRFNNKIKEIYKTMSCSFEEFRLKVILETKVAIYATMEKASRIAGGKIQIEKCETEIISRAENIARKLVTQM